MGQNYKKNIFNYPSGKRFLKSRPQWEKIFKSGPELSITYYYFQSNVPLLYSLKTSENWRFSDVFRGHKSFTLVEHGLTTIVLPYMTMTYMSPKKPKPSCVTRAINLTK